MHQKNKIIAEARKRSYYAFVARDLMPAEVTLTYDLPMSTEIERTDNVDYAITWRGDEIIGISPNSDFLPFYPDAL